MPLQYGQSSMPISALRRLVVLAFLFSGMPAPANPAFRVSLLPGHDTFTFSMGGCPAQLDSIKALVKVMKTENLGNGFDPGPAVSVNHAAQYEFLREVGWPVVGYACTSDHQVKDGTCFLSPEREAIVKILDDAGIFTATQLGEWGYYFHNLSHNEGWWRAVYGKDFEKRKASMKPTGLSGYDAMPKSRRECHAIVEDYFKTRHRCMRQWNLSVTGHSHYEAYAGQWGARVIGLELGENIAFTQSKIAFARGASRRTGIPFSIQVSPWFHGSCTTHGPLHRVEGSKYARGADAGHSLNFYARMWLHAWFSGTAMVTVENGSNIFFEGEKPPYKLTPHARKAAEVFRLMQSRDRGVPYMPMAVVIDKFNGYNAYMGKPWGILEPTAADLELRDLFQEQLFPGSDHIHRRPFPDNPEASYLRPTPFGEMADVQLSDAPAEVLARYPVILLAGDIAMDPAFVKSLRAALAGGCHLLLGKRHAKALGRRFLPGKHEVLQTWKNPKTGRTTVISNNRLKALCRKHLPIIVEGDPVQYQVNRNKRGWVIELVNNSGVIKFPAKPAVMDPERIARVTLRPKFDAASAREWISGRAWKAGDTVSVEVPPGGTAFVEFTPEVKP